MSKSKKRREQEPRARQKRRSYRPHPKPLRAADVCRRAEDLCQSGRLDEALLALEEFDKGHPGNEDVLRSLLKLYGEQRDTRQIVRTCERLIAKCPEDQHLYLIHAAGLMTDMRPASALQVLQGFVARWPDDPLADGARTTIAQMEPAIAELVRDAPFPDGERVALAALHEEVISALANGDHVRAIAAGEQLLSQAADFAPAMNNLCQAYFLAGRGTDALAMAARVLAKWPNNLIGLANQAKFAFLTGDENTARRAAERLADLPCDGLNALTKKAETFSLLGDDERVLKVLESARLCGTENVLEPEAAMLHHLAAVAALRLSDRRRALALWKKAIRIDPSLAIAVENLHDARHRAGNRQGPWPFYISQWLPWSVIEELASLIDSASRSPGDDQISRAARQFALEHPELVKLVPALLDRGDPVARNFAHRFAILLATPDMHQALVDFALGQRGSDETRMEIVRDLQEAKALPRGELRLWIKGRQQAVQSMGYEITYEPTDPLRTGRGYDLTIEAHTALRAGDAARAERCLKECLEIVGQKPDLLNNLANAYLMQRRNAEARELVRQIYKRWPDYLFGQTAMAIFHIKDGKLDEAEALLEPLRMRERFHVSEFTALCGAHVQLCHARGRPDGARAWLKMWGEVAPDHPDLNRLKWMGSRRATIRRLLSVLRGEA